MSKCGIYFIVHRKSKRAYVGQSIDIIKRWTYHRSALNSNTHHCKYLQRLWNKYGQDNFQFRIVRYCDAHDLDRYEEYYYKKLLSTQRLVNCRPPGQARGWKHSSQTKLKMSKSAKLVSNTEYQKSIRSERAKKQHREGNIGRKLYQIRKRICNKCGKTWIPERMPSGNLCQSKFCINCRPEHKGGYYKYERVLWDEGRPKSRYSGAK